MSRGAKAAFAVWGLGIGWDLLCRPGETISEAIAGGIANKRTRPLVLGGIIVHVAHVLLMASRMRRQQSC